MVNAFLTEARLQLSFSLRLIMKFQLVLMALLVVVLNACVRVPNIHLVRSKEHREDVYIDEENRLNYFGKLNKNSNETLFDLYEKSETKPKTLIIFSMGGDVYRGMDVGRFVFDHKIDVVVNRMCGSSCANYIFTAAQNKYLKPDSILFWHGSSWQPNINESVEKGLDWAVKWRNTEIEYFKKISVDYRITVNGFKQYQFKNRLKTVLSRMPIMGFNYSIDDMQKFGVRHVFLTDEKWNWKEANKCCHILRVKAAIDATTVERVSGQTALLNGQKE